MNNAAINYWKVAGIAALIVITSPVWLPVVIMGLQVFFALGTAFVIGMVVVSAYKAFFTKDYLL